MALDRFVYWKDRKPNKTKVRYLLEDFFGKAAKIEYENDVFWIELPGKLSHPLRREPYYKDIAYVKSFDNQTTEQSVRWIEVWVNKLDEHLDVLTRQMDEYTNVLAKGLYDLFIRAYEAQTEEEHFKTLEKRKAKC